MIMVKEMLKERKALHEHMERLSCGGEAPTSYLDYDVPGRFADLYKLSIADSLLRLIFLLTGAYAIVNIGKAVKKLFRG